MPKITTSHYQERCHSPVWQCPLLLPFQQTFHGFIIYPSFCFQCTLQYLGLRVILLPIFKAFSCSFGSCCCHKPFFHSAAHPRSEIHPGICSLKLEQMEESRRDCLCQHKVALSFCGKCSPRVKLNPRQTCQETCSS